MPPDPTTQPDPTPPPADDIDARVEALVNARINGAITAHTARLEKKFQAELQALRAPAPAPPPAPADPAPGQPAKADPEVLRLRESLEKLAKQAEASEKARLATEERARRDSARQAVREALAKANVNPALLPALVSHFEASGAMGHDEEGRPFLKVKRERIKGAPESEEVFEDLAAGVADWAKGREASAYTLAPTPSVPGGPRMSGSGSRGAQPPALPEAKSLSEAARNAAEMFRRQGLIP